LPIGSRCVVQGPCHDAGCPCQGMNLTIDSFICPEGVRVINYQHTER